MALLIKVASRIHLLIYRMTRGSIGGSIVHSPVLLLTTTGRKSGRPHTVPLLFTTEGDFVAVIASNGGSRGHPAWFLNLQKNAECRVTIKGRAYTARAEVVTGQDREATWQRAVAMYPGYTGYQRKTPRQIPVIWLKPVEHFES